MLSLVNISSFLTLFSSQHFTFLSTSGFLYLSLQLLVHLSLGVSLVEDADSSQPEVRLVLHQVLLIIVNQSESSRSVSTEGSSESVKDDIFGFVVVLSAEQLLEVFLGDVGFSFVIDIEDKFSSGEKLVNSNPSGFNGYGHNNNLIIY